MINGMEDYRQMLSAMKVALSRIKRAEDELQAVLEKKKELDEHLKLLVNANRPVLNILLYKDVFLRVTLQPDGSISTVEENLTC
jgi:DNA polymerase III psi subunit